MKIDLIQVSSGIKLGLVLHYLWGAKKLIPNKAIYATSDSVLLIPQWLAFCEAPRSVAMQLETHKKKDGFYLWMTSARPDRNAQAAKEYSRDQPVKFVMLFSTASAKTISHLRLCNKAEAPTREFVELWKSKLLSLSDTESVETAKQMMPMCAYRNGLCTEMRGCGKPKKYPKEDA